MKDVRLTPVPVLFHVLLVIEAMTVARALYFFLKCTMGNAPYPPHFDAVIGVYLAVMIYLRLVRIHHQMRFDGTPK